MNKAHRTFLAFALGGIALSAVSFVIWVNVNQDIGGLMFGHVVVAAPSSLTITDRDNRIRLIRIATGTVITDNGKAVRPEVIPVGQFVQISGRRAEHGVIDADVIRLMQSPRRDKPPHETPQ